MTVDVYFSRDQKIAAATRVIPKTQGVGAAAMRSLVEGPTSKEAVAGMTSAIPRGQRSSASTSRTVWPPSEAPCGSPGRPTCSRRSSASTSSTMTASSLPTSEWRRHPGRAPAYLRCDARLAHRPCRIRLPDRLRELAEGWLADQRGGDTGDPRVTVAGVGRRCRRGAAPARTGRFPRRSQPPYFHLPAPPARRAR